MLTSFLSGAILIAAWVIALFFFRFFRTSGDRLFGYFSVAFFLLGVERIWIEFTTGGVQAEVYLVRLLAFTIILAGILDKNRQGRGRD